MNSLIFMSTSSRARKEMRRSRRLQRIVGVRRRLVLHARSRIDGSRDARADDFLAQALRYVDPGFWVAVLGHVAVTLILAGGAIVLAGFHDAGALLFLTVIG